MGSLKDEYIETIKQSSWIQKPEEIGKSDQLYRIWASLTELIGERSLQEDLPRLLYRSRLSSAQKFLEGLRLALTDYEELKKRREENNQLIWSHRSGPSVVGSSKDSKEFINLNVLISLAADYLACPWMQHNEIDWILLDSLVYSEGVSYRESIMTGEQLGITNWAYIIAEGDIGKSLWIRLILELWKWALRYIVPPATIATLYFLDYELSSIVVRSEGASLAFHSQDE